MCDIADGYNDVQTTTWHKARKQHVCCACHEPIAKGVRYARSFIVYDGSVESFKHCARCWLMLEALLDAVDSDVAIDWRLNCGADWLDEIGDLPDEVAALAFLTPAEAQQTIAVRVDL